MVVEAVNYKETRHSVFIPAIQGAALGATVGYVGKYALPITREEKNSDEYIKVSNKINREKTHFNVRTQKFVNSLKSKEDKSLAEDEFVKMFDGLKEGETVKKSSIRNAIKKLGEESPEQLLAFKKLCKKSSEIAEKTAKQCLNAYNLVTKHIRPTGFFLAAGAISGAFIAVAHDILKTEVKSNISK